MTLDLGIEVSFSAIRKLISSFILRKNQLYPPGPSRSSDLQSYSEVVTFEVHEMNA